MNPLFAVPAAGPPSRPRPLRERLWEAADAGVVTLHEHGFLQSLIVHAAALLGLALLVVEPPVGPRARPLRLAFAAADSAPVDTVAIAVSADDSGVASGGSPAAAEPPVPVPDMPAAVAPVELAEVDPAAADPPVPGADVDLALLVAAMPAGGTPMDAAVGPRSVGPLSARGAGRGMGEGQGAGTGRGSGIGGEIGRRLRAAGAGTGDVQVSIAWNNLNDIDVHVLVESPAFAPGVSLVNYTSRRGVCGGWLDVDENVLPRTPLAVENVFWARGFAPPGRYTVAVHHYRNWGGPDPTPVEIVVLRDGWQKRFEAVVHAGRAPLVVTSFVRRHGDTTRLEDDGWIPATGP